MTNSVSDARVASERTVLPERNLDILRSIAVMLVVVDHLLQTMGNHGHFAVWAGQAGVSAFFVHTSLVLMASLERDGAPATSNWISRFYIRRAFRIYPLAWVVIAIVCALHVAPELTTTWEPVTRGQLISNLGLFQDLALRESVWPVLWTLPLEMEMYVLLPFCFLLARKQSWVPMIALIVLACVLGALSTYGIRAPHELPGMKRLPLLRFIICFLCGVLAYRMLRIRTREGMIPWWAWPLIIAVNVALGTWTYFHMQSWMSRGIFCAVLGLTIPLLQDAPKGVLARIANKIATYSYGIYLLHQAAIRVGFEHFAEQALPVKLLVTFVALALMCLVAYHLIEKPFIDLGRKLLGDRGTRPSLEATAPPP